MYWYLQGQQHINIHDIYAGHCNTAFNVNKRVFFFFFSRWWHLVLSIRPLRSPKPISMGLSHLFAQTLSSTWIFILRIFWAVLKSERTIHRYTKTKSNITVTKTLVYVPQPIPFFLNQKKQNQNKKNPKKVKLSVCLFDSFLLKSFTVVQKPLIVSETRHLETAAWNIKLYFQKMMASCRPSPSLTSVSFPSDWWISGGFWKLLKSWLRSILYLLAYKLESQKVTLFFW